MSIKLGDVITKYKDVETSGDFVEWVKKLELVAKLKDANGLEGVLPLYLDGPAFSVYSQLKREDQADYKRLKAALTAAFCPSPFSAYDQLRRRTLQPGESPDVYLSDIRRLILLTGCEDAPEEWVRCAFVGGLPTEARSQLTAMVNVMTMAVGDLVARARTILSVAEETTRYVAMGKSEEWRRPVRCFQCGKIGHISKACKSRRATQLRCFLCGEEGHIVRNCPRQGNCQGAESLAAPGTAPSKE